MHHFCELFFVFHPNVNFHKKIHSINLSINLKIINFSRISASRYWKIFIKKHLQLLSTSVWCWIIAAFKKCKVRSGISHIKSAHCCSFCINWVQKGSPYSFVDCCLFLKLILPWVLSLIKILRLGSRVLDENT